jgi:serine protease Do
MSLKIKKNWLIPLIIIIAFMAGQVLSTRFGMTSNPPAVASVPDNQSLATQPSYNFAKQLSETFENAAQKLDPCVVPIFAEQVVEAHNPFAMQGDPFREFFGDDMFKRFFNAPSQGQKQTVHSLGSGVIVSTDGYILTNNHVVQGADKLTVMLADKNKYTAKIVGTDPQTDVAVIKIDAKNLTAASLGNSDDVKVGQWVIAIGNPFQLMHSVTSGIISAKGRSDVHLADYEDFIQTDAAINPGNSGGALADLDGNVIGINTAINSPSGGNVGIGFAIPINMAKNVMDKLISTGKVTRGFLAVGIQDVTDNMAKALKLKNTEGALIGDVNADGPADKAGIKSGDIIIQLDDTKIHDSQELRMLVAQRKPGTSGKITLIRDGKEMQLTVVFGERPKDIKGGGGEEKENEPEEQNFKKLGIDVQNLTSELANRLGYQNQKGVLIANVDGGSPADEAGLQNGDLIKEVNRVKVTTVQEFKYAIGKVQSGDAVALLVRRGSSSFFVAITMP